MLKLVRQIGLTPPKENIIDLCLQEANKGFRSGRGMLLLDGNERLMIQES